MDDVSKLDLTDLQKRLKTLEDELEELEEEKGYVLRQTGLHVSGSAVKQYETQTIALQEAIKALQEEIKVKSVKM